MSGERKFAKGDKVIVTMFGGHSQATVVRVASDGDVIVHFDDPDARRLLPLPYGRYEPKDLCHVE